MKELFKKESKKILIYPSVEREVCPVEKNVEHILLNPIPIRALVNDLTFASAQWKMPGVSISQAKDLLIEKKHESKIKNSYKIEIDGNDFWGWRINGKLQLRNEGDEYIRCYVYTEG